VVVAVDEPGQYPAPAQLEHDVATAGRALSGKLGDPAACDAQVTAAGAAATRPADVVQNERHG
jgi:hypothetical protein